MIIKKPMNKFTNGGRRGKGSRDDHPKNWGHNPIGNGGLPKPIPGGGVTPPPRVNTLYQRGGAVNRKFHYGGGMHTGQGPHGPGDSDQDNPFWDIEPPGEWTQMGGAQNLGPRSLRPRRKGKVIPPMRQGGGRGRSSTHYDYHYWNPDVGYHKQYQMRFMDVGNAYGDTTQYIDVSTQAKCQDLGGNWSTAWGNSGICNISSPNFTMGYLHPQGAAASGKHIHDVNLDGTVNVQDIIEVRNTALAEGNSYNRGGSVHRSRKRMVRGGSLNKRAVNSGWQQYTKFPEVRDHYPECPQCPAGCYPVGDCNCNCWA